MRNNTQGSSWGRWLYDRQLGIVFLSMALALFIWWLLWIFLGPWWVEDREARQAANGKVLPSAQVSAENSKPVSAEAASHVCDGCVAALKAVEDLARNLRARYDLVPTEQRLTPAEYEQARAYLASATVDDLPSGWESGIVVKKRAEGGGHDFALLVADGSYRVLQAGAYSEGPVPGNQLNVELDGHELAALLDLGDHLVLNPTAFGRSRESPQWVLKVGEFRLVKKFAVPTAPPK